MPKLLLLPNDLFDYIIKFSTYHLLYKEKLLNNLIQTFGCIINFSYLLCNFENLLVTFLLACNGNTCIAKLSFII